jgi:transcriptional regulator with GAF, ATPase, and Fis domain
MGNLLTGWATLFSWRKAVLFFPGLLICIYAAVVLWYAYSMPDIGLGFAFDTAIKKVEKSSVTTASQDPPKLDKGDHITKVGSKEVARLVQDRLVGSWPLLLQAINNLRDGGQEPVFDVDTLNQAEVDGRAFVSVGGIKYVRVEYEHGGTHLSCWCKVGPLPPEELVPSVLWFFLKLGLFMVGALIFWNRPTDRIAAQFFLLCIVTLGAYMGGYHWSRIAGRPGLILVFMVCGVLLPPVLLHFYAIFPRPKLLFTRFRVWSLLLIYGLPVLFLALIMASYFYVWHLNHQEPPASVEEVNGVLGTIRGEIFVYLGVAALWYLASVGCLARSYYFAPDATERDQIKWIWWGSLVAVVPIGISLCLAILRPDAFSVGAATWPMFAASVCFTAAFIISFLRYRLMQLDQMLSSGLVYFFVSFLAVLVYYAVVFVGMYAMGGHFGSPLSQALSVSTTALMLMFLLDLARRRLKKVLDRRLNREKFLLDRTLQRMGQAIEQLVDRPRLARQLLQASAEVLGANRGAIYLREGTPPLYRLVGALGPEPPLVELSPGCPLVEALEARPALLGQPVHTAAIDPVQRQLRFLGGSVAHALVDEGELLALLVLGPKELGHYYSWEDINVLAAFTRLTSLALKSAERHQTIEGLNRELQTKVEKISEQQRRILALQSQLTRQSTPAEDAALGRGLQTTAQRQAAAGGMVGSSLVVQHLLQLTKKVSASQSAVLIRGESGTGKELLARALHENSPRAGKAFVKVHCAALAPGLLESELFGHVKGAFTGAHKDKVGRFELANGGTLFLDEIGDISLDVQTKLLRVLQEMTFERVGASEPVKVDVRVIAATHQHLERLIVEGRFREDLYYRLNVISVAVPPLRERIEDIPELAMHFLKLHAQRSGKAVSQVDDDALALLKSYGWPGNIRQLENVIERAIVVAEGTSITIDDLPEELLEAVDGTSRLTSASPQGNGNGSKLPFEPAGIRGEREERDRRERERLVRALAQALGNKAKAARALGLARSTLVSRLKKHGLS